MAVSHRVTGTWAELTASGAVAIPATPEAGDRMYLFARWKDFAITAQVTSPEGWTQLAEFADGTINAGNGTGSVKVACWYRDWQSGDTNPTIDFSSSPNNASAVITVMAKGADDVWLTPVAVTAAMTDWTTTSQVVSASATVAVKSGGVVMGLIGIRDDTADMTRPTAGIDDSVGAVTWNGNYVESPDTHHTTTTGFDGAADLGYRLVTTGATATLQMTGTISAAETGAALWVVQGVSIVLIPSTISFSLTAFVPSLLSGVTPANATLSASTFTPKLALTLIPDTQPLTVVPFAPSLNSSTGPNTAILTLTTFAPQLHEQITPTTTDLLVSTFAPSPSTLLTVIPSTLNLTVTLQSALLSQGLTPASASLALSTFGPTILPFHVIYLDPGGDAVQAVGYFNTIDAGTPPFDSTQQVVGVGSYKFDSDTGIEVRAKVAGVLGLIGAGRRVSFYFRYDSVPSASVNTAEFVGGHVVYSGGGFAESVFLHADDGVYATAMPARNAGQGSSFASLSLVIPIGAVIDSVKIIYERKYDTNTSIGISRVKWRVNGEEGPNHDNTDQPLTDTVVEVDVTAERGWTWQDLQNGAFDVITEARRGDTDTAHTQSWDYVKVEVVYHLPAVILNGIMPDGSVGYQLAISPKDDGVVLRFVAGDGDSFDGISTMLPDSWYRISFGFVQHGTDDLEVTTYLDGIQELSIEGASTGGFSGPFSDLQYGWILSPGANHLCWLDQLYIDDGDDLSDPGNKRITAKLPASVNENNWDTTGGTGAVNERPLSETNFRQHAASTGVRQTYTLQSAATGDVDLTGESIVGYMGWAWAKRGAGDLGDSPAFIVNNVLELSVSSSPIISLSATPALLKAPVTSVNYPSHAAGIGMRSNEESGDTFMYECGVVVAYEGPTSDPDSLLDYQTLAEGSTTNLIDDLRGDPQSSYELCYKINDGPADVLITIYSVLVEGQPRQLQGICGGQGGSGRTRIMSGLEVQVDVEVTGASASVAIWRRLNVDYVP